jgi:hypothetical protein
MSRQNLVVDREVNLRDWAVPSFVIAFSLADKAATGSA